MTEQQELNSQIEACMVQWVDPRPPKTIDSRDLDQMKHYAIGLLLTAEAESLSDMIKRRALPKGLANEVAFLGVGDEIPKMRAYFRRHSAFLQEVASQRLPRS